MFNKRRRYSYAAQKNQRHYIRWFLIWFGLFFVSYTLITSFCFSMVVLENKTMEPGLSAGDRFIFSSYRLLRLFSGRVSREPPFRRGNIILVDLDLDKNRGFFRNILEGVVRFVTIQQVGMEGRAGRVFIKRVIGLPGDEIAMINFVIRVRPAGEPYGYTEFELSDQPYDIAIPQVPALWDESIPFSGNMDPLVLGEDECFLLSDDRSNTNDSRTWGPVSSSLITGKALFRYWPFTRMGRP
jgi:signal peptidase I